MSVSTISAPGTPTTSTPSPGNEPTRATYWRRRAVAITVLLVAAFLLTALIGRVGAEAELEDKVAGHVVVEPGETLWDVAAQTAPDGVDTREQLRAVAELNGFEGSSVDAWTVVLIPAR
jgi:Tfp pilus assembly protein FimV